MFAILVAIEKLGVPLKLWYIFENLCFSKELNNECTLEQSFIWKPSPFYFRAFLIFHIYRTCI